MSECIADGVRPALQIDARHRLRVLFGLAVAYFLARPIWRAQFLVEIWFTKSWNAYLTEAKQSLADRQAVASTPIIARPANCGSLAPT